MSHPLIARHITSDHFVSSRIARHGVVRGVEPAFGKPTVSSAFCSDSSETSVELSFPRSPAEPLGPPEAEFPGNFGGRRTRADLCPREANLPPDREVPESLNTGFLTVGIATVRIGHARMLVCWLEGAAPCHTARRSAVAAAAIRRVCHV